MSTTVSMVLGGIGLFLLGMGLMTDSLTALGGAALRRLLQQLTKNRVWAVLTGAAVTATVQSSSATTLVTIGFVSAGLLSFSQSLGIMFGANLGTTSTAWIVAMVGLKVDVSVLAMPLVGVGALLRLVTRGRRARMGLALSGFGLVFVGIDVLQDGMAGLDLDLTPSAGSGGLLGTLTLVGVGTVMTVVMQSSSAAVATTLVALHAGSINLQQAAALVIGQNVGTTVTAVIGAIGGTIAARRAAAAHTLFNVFTGAIAVAILGPFLAFVQLVGARLLDVSPETTIALFHTAFNFLGVAVFVPLTRPFARVVERLIPERGNPIVQRLSTSVLQVPAMALEVARRSTADLATEALALAAASLRSAIERPEQPVSWRRVLASLADPRALLDGVADESRALARRLRDAKAAAIGITGYLARIRTTSERTELRDEHVELIHAIDHVRRLLAVLEREEELEVVHGDEPLQRLAREVLDDLAPTLDPRPEPSDVDGLARAAAQLGTAVHAETSRRTAHRAILLARLADGDLQPEDVERHLSAARWISKTPEHAHRAFVHLGWTAGSLPIPQADD
jgi:phosphate:Na+ symporter